MNGNVLISIYIKAVDNLMGTDDIDNMYVMSADMSRVFFNADDFRDEIHDLLSDAEIMSELQYTEKKRQRNIEREVLQSYKTLGLIICDKGKFTTTQRVAGKVRRVVVVDYKKFELLKSLNW